MTADIAVTLGTGLTVFLTMVLPPLGAAVVAGLSVAVLQAATQVQDQTLPQTVKLLVVVGTFGVLAGALFGPLVAYAESMYSDFWRIVR